VAGRVGKVVILTLLPRRASIGGMKGLRIKKNRQSKASGNDNNEYRIADDDWQCALQTVNVEQDQNVRNDIGLWGRSLHAETDGQVFARRQW